jgi:hypothetical protein
MPVRSVHIKEYKGAAERWAHCYICFHPKPSREIPRRSSAAESAAGQGYLAVLFSRPKTRSDLARKSIACNSSIPSFEDFVRWIIFRNFIV